MNKIWAVGNNFNEISQRVHQLCFDTNLKYDNLLLPYDIKGLIAHCTMLQSAHYITEDECRSINQTLQEMKEDVYTGVLTMTPEWEDCHSLIEAELIKRVGPIGKKLYMARSRNDQIVSALRLYTAKKIESINTRLKELMYNILHFAKENRDVPMAGYTHTQRAMPSSVGLWITSYLEILLDQKNSINTAVNLNSVNTLGTAAGYGTSFNIEREIITRELGLERTLINSLSCQLSRGQVECQTLQSYWGVMFTLNRLANDLVLFTSSEFNFFTVGESCTTGSSIMPNKKNLDPCEIVRARYHKYSGYIDQIKGMISNLISGYNSDFQETKPLFIDGLDLIENCIEIITIVISQLKTNKDGLLQALTPEIYATDLVNNAVKSGKSFRESYQEVKKSLDSVSSMDPYKNIEEKRHLGAIGNIGLELFEQRLNDF